MVPVLTKAWVRGFCGWRCVRPAIPHGLALSFEKPIRPRGPTGTRRALERGHDLLILSRFSFRFEYTCTGASIQEEFLERLSNFMHRRK